MSKLTFEEFVANSRVKFEKENEHTYTVAINTQWQNTKLENYLYAGALEKEQVNESWKIITNETKDEAVSYEVDLDESKKEVADDYETLVKPAILKWYHDDLINAKTETDEFKFRVDSPIIFSEYLTAGELYNSYLDLINSLETSKK